MHETLLRSRTLAGLFFAAVLLAAALPAHAAPGGLPTHVAHTDSSPEWKNLRARLFQTVRKQVEVLELVQQPLSPQGARGHVPAVGRRAGIG
ncbi:hypothetical protein [Methylibium sp.]|uniref:hypothetical protein n=1 Tax=Methylibium sp. TaxID=2067992 RepID=UPI003D1233ED